MHDFGWAFDRMRRLLAKLALCIPDSEGLVTHYTNTMHNRVKLLCKMIFTIKTHKQLISLRPMHAASGHPFSAVMKLLSSYMKSNLKQFEHICWSSDEVVAKLKSLTIPPEFRSSLGFAKLDVKDFFLCGKFRNLAASSFKHIDTIKLRDCLTEIAQHILECQFISVQELADVMYQVISGSGMGLGFSSDIADSHLLDLAELPFASLKFQQRLHNVLAYMRYRDDILVIFVRKPGRRSHEDFLRQIVKLASSTYKIECEQVSSTSVPFLDLYVYKSDSFMRTGKLSFRPYIKDTEQKVYLSHLSCHPAHIHTAWPVSEVARLYRRSSCWESFAVARRDFVNKLHAIFMHPMVIQLVMEWQPSSRCASSNRLNKLVWIVIPFTPVIKGFQHQLDGVQQRWRNAHFDLPCKVSHKRGAQKSLHSFLVE
jgi:hypothetical protein